ncbi:GNAT family N-acetyltransferase [Marinococcus luteus]|uniref:GNAT family N-acetyltransferase n=1 Tax=Marinococcus luteus TaxID=1122204 RepID=UPI002ACC39F3|nr:GNAT family N-acetyltransferase [Marinococcus luteus]MDZ5784016.1 GNAT family N-acetyltransferase [Marinococcus luteus]
MRQVQEAELKVLGGGDAEAYAALRMQALEESPEAFASTLEEERQKPDLVREYKERLEGRRSFTWGIEAGSELAGVITLLPMQMQKLQHKATILAMYVKPSFRAYGFGSRLVKAALKQADQDGVEQVQLTVVSKNKRAVRLYEACGFSVFSTEKEAMKTEDGYDDEHWMVCFLK